MSLSLLYYNQFWNIGFSDLTPKGLIDNKSLGPIEWMIHPYKDRWFADPFILDYSENEIRVLVEECKIKNPKGIICELIVDRWTKKLKERFVLLELDTHLSYPFIVRKNNKIYICPENGASHQWIEYEYDGVCHKLINPQILSNEAIADASVFENNGNQYMIATLYPNTLENAFLYKLNTKGIFEQYIKEPVSTGLVSRPGGSFFKVYNKLYRPVQDCRNSYGGALAIAEVNFTGESYHEEKSFMLTPFKGRYELGLHTLNFYKDLCVIDGCGYLYPFFGHLYEFLRTIKRAINSK